ncbi:hypothetical protein JW926_18975 [Candidatus Sumerlaeota bacterium]|nr:hypothetical protein [Candidatus Sumerlaeota bacterium]
MNRYLLTILLLFSVNAFCGKEIPEQWKFDFGETQTEKGFIGVNNKIPFSEKEGFGWVSFPQYTRDRVHPDSLLRDFIFSNSPAVFRVNLNPGIYRISFIMGEMQYSDHSLKISIPSLKKDFPEIIPKKGEYVTISAALEIKVKALDIHFDSPRNNWIINALTIEPSSRIEDVKISKERKKVKIAVQDTWEDVAHWDDPIAPYVKKFRANLSTISTLEPTGLSRNDYLKVIEGNVDYFKTLQDESGAIIDPHRNVEYQYSTPCFALASATLVVHKGRKDLLEHSAKAMDWATWTLSQRKAATAHEDFYSHQIARALPLLKSLVDSERYAKWEQNIRSFDPYETYRSGVGGGNWNVVALSGEALFHLLGIRKDKKYIEDCLAMQGRFFNSKWGLYTEGPMPYDHFPRIWAADMLEAGFQGKYTDKLRIVLDRAALTSLFMQSPMGELPAGGRSAHHQWNEAEQCFTYEIYAARAKKAGDLEMAGVYKRAAHLALGSVKRWMRPSGELWIVKNKVDPAKFHGYEGYSSHSQYNLLAMAMLSIAFKHAASTEDVLEKPSPADIGGFVFQIPPPHHKAFANAGGMYVEIDYSADLHYNPTGLIRIHKKGFNPQLGPSDGLTETPSSRYPEGPRATCAIGASWKNSAGKWRRLGEFGNPVQAELKNVKESPEFVSFDLEYQGDFDGVSKIVESYEVKPDKVGLRVSLENYKGPFRYAWPVLSDNGEKKTSIEILGNTVKVTLDGESQTYMAEGGGTLKVEEQEYPFKSGWARLAVAEYPEASAPLLLIQPVSKNR